MQKQRSTVHQETTGFEGLLDVLIQDPIRDCAYLLTAEDLKAFVNSAASWSSIGANTVTFIIPDEDGFEEIPPFSQSASDAPDVLIQWPAGRKSFHLPFSALEERKIALESAPTAGYGISFSIPRGTELIDELPALRAAILQSGELQFR